MKTKRKSKAKRAKMYALHIKGPKKSAIVVVSSALLKSDHADGFLAEECKRLDLGEPVTIQTKKPFAWRDVITRARP
jgi:hypothetical protein